MRFRACSILLALALAACASGEEAKDSAYYPAEEAEATTGTAMPPSPSAPRPMMAPKREAKKRDARSRSGRGGAMDAEAALAEEPMPSDDAPGGAPDAPPKRKRMVHYNGHLRLKVTNPTETLQRASEIADAVGGYVEVLTSSSVVLRVPVAHFRTVYNDLTQIGEVLSRSMSATDVTDAFVATELRAEILTASRDRLIALLSKARGAREKLRLLREIKRLTEQIDQLEMQLTALASLADYSRLTVEAQPHQVHVGSQRQEPIAAFRWIHRLSPFNHGIAEYGDELELKVPEGLVALDYRDYFVAESAEGTVFWASARDNKPEGTTDFWATAIESRLGLEYGGAEVTALGDFKVVRLVDQSEKAYRYLIGVRAVGDDLQVVEVYYPNEAEEKRYAAAVNAAITGGAR